MKRFLLIVLLGLTCISSATLRAQDKPLFTRTEDVVYGRKLGTALTLDVFEPAKKNGAAVFWVVSGGFKSDHDGIKPAMYAPLLARGYTVFAVVHGSQPRFIVPEIQEDIHRAIRFVRHNASRWGVDPNRFGISGTSAGGHLSLAIGTQALLQTDIEFANLGLVVVDEQHKLGVKQRASLKNKGLSPHYLVMTATPIPRTLALSYFADFELSTIDHLPPGRQPIKTRWLRTAQGAQAYDFIREQVGRGRQAYIVLPQIEDDGVSDNKSVKAEFDRLSKGPLSSLRLATLHGQMSTEEKQAAMLSVRDGQTDVLIATTVIEVGIDVPNACVILIDNADRFGLSQLHQLRGRVGRGKDPSTCLLVSDPPSDVAEQRLRAMTETSNGFDIAEMDLQLRGPGEFFGTRQHGLPEFKMADVTQELEMLNQAREDALALLAEDPKLAAAEHQNLREALIAQFGDSLLLAQVG